MQLKAVYLSPNAKYVYFLRYILLCFCFSWNQTLGFSIMVAVFLFSSYRVVSTGESNLNISVYFKSSYHGLNELIFNIWIQSNSNYICRIFFDLRKWTFCFVFWYYAEVISNSCSKFFRLRYALILEALRCPQCPNWRTLRVTVIILTFFGVRISEQISFFKNKTHFLKC
jgi:hypothetical protein